MIPYSLLTISILIALAGIFICLRAGKEKLSSSWHRLLLSVTMAVFVFLFGAWVFLSVYLKYIFAACFAVVLVFSLLRPRGSVALKNTKERMVWNLFFTAILGTLSILYFTGTTGKPYGIANLKFPIKNGTYFVFQGGKGLPTNIFHYGLRGAVYAMDIVKLNHAGNRANHIFSTRLEDYDIFNDTIYSPCNGIVIHTTENNPDNIPPHRQRGPTNTNHVLIETDSYYVFIAHMKYDKVFVKEGERVGAGQPLGLVGNSGFSIEPHLHMQVHAKTNKDLPWYKERPLLIEFDGKAYLLFEVIHAKGDGNLL